jgi:hypothetical protein
MTAIIAWSTFDGHEEGPASLYLASDSRISRELPGGGWDVLGDSHQKIFASEQTADIFGFCGPIEGVEKVVRLLRESAVRMRESKGYGPGSETEYSSDIFEAALAEGAEALRSGVQIFHGYRFKGRRFGLAQVRATSDGQFARIDYSLPDKGGLLFREGLGAQMVQKSQEEYFDTEAESKGFSRWLWMSFHESLERNPHPTCGGAPQLAGLYTRGPGITLGVCFKGIGYVSGKQRNCDDIEYRDVLFQRVDARGVRLPNAQPHARMGRARLFQFAR